MIWSCHIFAPVATAQLSWHVQNWDMIWSKLGHGQMAIFHLKANVFFEIWVICSWTFCVMRSRTHRCRRGPDPGGMTRSGGHSWHTGSTTNWRHHAMRARMRTPTCSCRLFAGNLWTSPFVYNDHLMTLWRHINLLSLMKRRDNVILICVSVHHIDSSTWACHPGGQYRYY